MTESDWLQSDYPVVVQDAAMRLTAAEHAYDELIANPGHRQAWKNCEFIALQIRKICELLLLGSTLAHLREGGADLDPRKWRPKDAFGELAKLSGHALQVPVDLKLHSHPSGYHQVLPVSLSLPFRILNSVYGSCGEVLHIPSAKKVVTKSIPPFDARRFKAWLDGFRRLINGHALLLPDVKLVLLSTWSGVEDESPSVYLLSAEGESITDWSSYPEFDLLEP